MKFKTHSRFVPSVLYNFYIHFYIQHSSILFHLFLFSARETFYTMNVKRFFSYFYLEICGTHLIVLTDFYNTLLFGSSLSLNFCSFLWFWVTICDCIFSGPKTWSCSIAADSYASAVFLEILVTYKHIAPEVCHPHWLFQNSSQFLPDRFIGSTLRTFLVFVFLKWN